MSRWRNIDNCWRKFKRTARPTSLSIHHCRDRRPAAWSFVGAFPVSASDLRVGMKDFLGAVEKLRRDAAEAALIRDLATQKTKRDTFDRLHHHYVRLANEVEQAMKTAKVSCALASQTSRSSITSS